MTTHVIKVRTESQIPNILQEMKEVFVASLLTKMCSSID